MTRVRSLVKKSFLLRRRKDKRRRLPPGRKDRLLSLNGGKNRLSRNASNFTARTSIAKLVLYSLLKVPHP